MGSAPERHPLTILIPAYNPDEKLFALVGRLRERFSRIVVVDDGSTRGKDVLARVRPLVEAVLVHERNRGKGAALKTGFAYLGDSSDVVTVDADGQHAPDDVAKVAAALGDHRGGLVLGVRSFVGKVPLRSRFGNWWTRWFFFLFTGILVRDTQTGLRGIPAPILPRIARIPGERYEYEMAMLADARHHPERPFQVPIATLYLNENATSHFNPLLDTIRIYRLLIQFCFSSILAFFVDNGVFALVMWFLASKDTPRREDVLVALVAARAVSSHINYFYNRFVVFRRSDGAATRPHRSYYGYFGLVLAVAAVNYALTEGCAALFDVQGAAVTFVKMVADAVLFVASYGIQKKFIFGSR